MCCPHLCHLLEESRSFPDMQKKCVELRVILQVPVLWDSMCMVLLSWGIGIALPSHCCAAVSAGHFLILHFF